ncbi:MAG: YlmH/Sll1252 family protein [Tissierellaceae bacterium]
MVLDRDFYTSHIKNKEKVFLMRRLIDKIEVVLTRHLLESTDFLDPYERVLAKSILNRFKDISYSEQGQGPDSERQIILIYPNYHKDFNIREYISALRISGDIQNLNHRDCLGSILGLGIKRDRIGDILVYEDYVDIVVKGEISNYILMNLERIADKKVSVREISLDSLDTKEMSFSEIKKTLSSYRLDIYLGAAYNLSRNESIDIIKSDRVKVNWEPVNKPSREVTVGDTISVKGLGRSVFYSVDGISKKGKIRANIRIII